LVEPDWAGWVVNEGRPEQLDGLGRGGLIRARIRVSQYVIHWGPMGVQTTFYGRADGGGMGNTIGHTYADGPNNYTISVGPCGGRTGT